MKVTTVAKEKERIVLLFENVTFAQMNTLRRLSMSETPVLAIEEVEFNKNSGILYDELIAHRLSLLPLTTDLGSYSLPTAAERENREYSAKSSVQATLTAKGPCLVLAKDLSFKDPKVKPVYPETPIVKLLEGQELEFIATATLGLGKEHTKWNPGLVYYRQRPSITIGKGVDVKTVAAVLNDTGLNAIKEKGGKLSVDEKALYLAENPDVYEDLSADIAVSFADDAFILTVESWGQLSPQTIITTAIERGTKLLKEFDTLVKAL